MKLRAIRRKNPIRREDPEKYYLVQQSNGMVDLRMFAKEISARSTLVQGDVENVLSNFVELMPVFLQLGYSVQLGNFCTCRISVRSKAKDELVDLTAKDIKSVKVVFYPSRELKDQVKNIEFELVK